ncbi:MAG: relaxase/mobilization nuclease domain-containing protein [Carboxylicivirga sp.]|nr:relaxase/mobilization nuclease domain-containing protein [Carboxylicivirga sp.]
MVIKIHQTESTKEAFNYNEKKVEQKHARFFHRKNTIELTPFVYSKAQRLAQLIDIENRNKRCKNKCFHVSVNPTNAELEKLTKNGLKKEIEAFMKHMGYGHQPYFVYEHSDLKRTHFHIVSTRIDGQSGKKISDSNEKRKVSRFINELQQRHKLGKTQDKPDKVQLIPTINSTNLHMSIQQVFKLLNQSNISNHQEYEDILKAFNLEVYQSEKGQLVLIKDQDGQTLRHPIALSQFKEGPNLPAHQTKETNEKIQQELTQKTGQILKELNKTYRFYTIMELREAFIRHKLLPYKLSKNDNLNIYSPLDKTVVDVQFILKRHKMRLQAFTLSNDQFYNIVREFIKQVSSKHDNIVEALADKEKSILDDKGNSKVVLKELNLESCETYNQVASMLDKKEQEMVRTAVKSHLEYLANKTIENVHCTSDSYQNWQGGSLWDKISHQLMIELSYYKDWEGLKNKKRERRKKLTKKRKGRYI